MGLRVKLLLVWFLLLLTPLAILGSIGYLYIDSQLKKDLVSYQANISKSIGQAIDNYLQRLNATTESAALEQSLVAFLSQRSSSQQSPSQSSASQRPSSNQRDRAAQQLQTLLENQYAIKNLYVVRANDFLTSALSVNAKNYNTDFPFAASELLTLVESERGVGLVTQVTDNAISRDRVERRVVAIAPITHTAANDTKKQHLGYLIAEANLDPLHRVVSNFSSNDTIVMALDSAGNNLSAGRIGFDALPNPAGLLQQSSNGFVESFAFSGKDYLVQIDALAYDFWLVSLTDKRLLINKKMPYIVIFIMTLSLTLLLSGVIFNLIVNNLAIKPVQKLIEATQQIAKGEFSPELNIKTNDELGELAVAFRQMGQQLMHTSKRIRQLAYYDPLTQLPNRTTLRETLNRLLARSEAAKTKCAVLFIDLDDFKKVNDRLGHEAGDELLIQISDRLKNRLRQADILFEQAGVTSVDQLISRRGGDEFNAILSSIKAPHDAAVVAERIIQDLNEPFFVAKSEIHVGASVGIAVFPDDGRDADTLLRNADLAMYEAKARGKNNYHIFTSAINQQVHQRLALENALQVAMVQNQFRLYYQPKVSLVDMSPVGFEALIRWQHPEKGMILPSKFIPVAEESNLIRDIGNWILGESMQQIQLWDKDLPPGVRIAINISARQLSQVDLVEQLQMMMEHFSISPQRLEIELTETSVLQDEQLAVQHLAALRNLGVEISLDDFGTGYSSLSFLRMLPIDTVKIDRSFTANVTHNSEARAIVVSLLSLCRELNVKTIAEGIETTTQLQFLMEHGCEQGQGFLFSEPLPAEEVMQFFSEPSYFA